MKFYRFFVIVLFCLPFVSTAQESKTNGLVEYNFINDYNLSDSLIDVKKYNLVFNDFASLFYENSDINENSQKMKVKSSENQTIDLKMKIETTDSLGRRYYVDKTRAVLISRELVFENNRGVAYIIEEEIPRIDWVLTKDHKKIGGFHATKATCAFRGRNYTAWYTEEVPLNIGPWKFQGLPGLILEVYDNSGQINIEMTSIKMPFESGHIQTPVDGQKISYDEYVKKLKRIDENFKRFLLSKLPRGAEVNITSVQDKRMELNR